jgi:hypothetical protein
MAPLRKPTDHNTRAYREEVERQVDRSCGGQGAYVPAKAAVAS